MDCHKLIGTLLSEGGIEVLGYRSNCPLRESLHSDRVPVTFVMLNPPQNC